MRVFATFLILVGLAGVAYAAQSPSQKCETAKYLEAGKYTACLARTEARLLKTRGACSLAPATVCYGDSDCTVGDTCAKDLTKYTAAVTKCEDKFAAKWNKLTGKALDSGSACPDGLDLQDVRQVLDECTANVAAGLAGDGLFDRGCNRSDGYWSSNPFAVDDREQWFVDFTDGGTGINSTIAQYPARAVRRAP